MRSSWVEVDLEAVAHNVRALLRLVEPAGLCAVVKADAYGHGDVPVAEAVLGAGASWLAVALVEEGIRLREAGIEAPILVLSEPPVDDAGTLVEWRLTPTVYRHAFLERLVALPGTAGVEAHLQLDTGMHRTGADEATALELAARLAEGGRVRLGGVWSHLAVADEDPEFTTRQIDDFSSFLARLTERGIDVPLRHLANTPGALLHPRARFDLVRTGLCLYGLHPSAATRSVIDLYPAMRIVSHVSMVRRLPAGRRPSYGRRRPLPADATVATVPVGYADGVPRLLSARGGEVLVGGRRRPLAGTVTMDQLMVDVGDDPVRIDDEVVLLGRQGGEEITADEWAERTETINYEVVARVGSRLPRRYLR